MKNLKTFESFSSEEIVNDWFSRSHNLKSMSEKMPFNLVLKNSDYVDDIKDKYENIEVVKIVNPRVKNPISYYIFIRNYSISELKNILIEYYDSVSEYGFISEEQVNVYKKMSEK